MRYIPLTQGKRALVDDDDYDRLATNKWCYHEGYASSARGKMHRIVIGAPNGIEVDHINRDKLDNRKINLRLSNRSQNTHNVGLRADNTSGQKGVNFFKPRKRWVARIQVEDKRYFLGAFKTKDEAILAYKRAETEYLT